jgi:segregation and condensation protein B
MDDITRDVPADVGSNHPGTSRSKGPAELLQDERRQAVEDGAAEESQAEVRGLAAFLVTSDRMTDEAEADGEVFPAPDEATMSVGGEDLPDRVSDRAGGFSDEPEQAAVPAAEVGPVADDATAPTGDEPVGQDAAAEAAAAEDAAAEDAAAEDAEGEAAAAEDAEGEAAAAEDAEGEDGLDAAEVAAALARDADTLEIDDEPLPDQEGLPEVPALADAEAVARIVHVLVLTQREGLTVFRLAQACNTTQKQVEEAVELLRGRIATSGLPVEIVRNGDTIRLMSSAEMFPFLQRLKGVKKAEKLSPAALETLAVIAYRQPVMRAEIEAIRGVKAGPMLRTLLQHKLVRITGRADVPGRPLQYGTTQHFLDRFGLASLQELPSLKEFKNLG